MWAECARSPQPAVDNDYASLPGRRGLPAGDAPVVRLRSGFGEHDARDAFEGRPLAGFLHKPYSNAARCDLVSRVIDDPLLARPPDVTAAQVLDSSVIRRAGGTPGKAASRGVVSRAARR